MNTEMQTAMKTKLETEIDVFFIVQMREIRFRMQSYSGFL